MITKIPQNPKHMGSVCDIQICVDPQTPVTPYKDCLGSTQPAVSGQLLTTRLTPPFLPAPPPRLLPDYSSTSFPGLVSSSRSFLSAFPELRPDFCLLLSSPFSLPSSPQPSYLPVPIAPYYAFTFIRACRGNRVRRPSCLGSFTLALHLLAV